MKAFLDKHNISYREKDIMNDEVARELLESDHIRKHFCDEKGCIVITFIVRLDRTWMYKEFFDVNGFSETRAMRIFNLI